VSSTSNVVAARLVLNDGSKLISSAASSVDAELVADPEALKHCRFSIIVGMLVALAAAAPTSAAGPT